MEHGSYIFRISCVYAILLLSFSTLAYHLYTIQIEQHTYLYSKAKSTYTASKIWRGKRGNIFDRNGNPLTGNLVKKNILADLSLLPEDPTKRSWIVENLSQILSVDPRILVRRFNSSASEVVVKNEVESELAQNIDELELPGIRWVDCNKRFYPKGSLLANVLGFTDSKNTGVYGLEAKFEKNLSPRRITQNYERDRKGRIIKYHSAPATESLNGDAVYLTIDEPIQHFLETELQEMVHKFAPKRAYAIMANPKTGAIMAMAQVPSFDPNNRSRMNPDHWRNHSISDVYDPGSTMKCIAVAGALDYGIVSLDSVLDCEDGLWRYKGHPLRDSGHHYGILSVAEIIQKSSNIGTAKIALMMGQKRLFQTLRRFGFGNKTGIGLGEESAGILRSLGNWDVLSITRFPIGQGISVTPLQMVQAYCALANQGKSMQLYLIDKRINARTKKVTVTQPIIKHYAIRQKAATDIVSAMTLVTEEGGTAIKAAVDGYVVAGKTGTSQKLVNGSYEGNNKYVASFIGFVPADDPAFVLLVIADEPSNSSYYGGTVAAPTFSRIANRTLRYLNVPPLRVTDINQNEFVKR